jgi:hypothetical protein
MNPTVKSPSKGAAMTATAAKKRAATGGPNITTASPASSNTGRKKSNNKNSQKKRPQSKISKSGGSGGKGSSTTSSNNGGLQIIKKKPYRRTKRPKNYCDKSTVTTVTTPTGQIDNHVSLGDASIINGNNAISTASGVNPFDAVLGECEDLLQASTEAQRLGRLKMASAYQLLLHTRLVGLGKRFDRSAMMVELQQQQQQQQGYKMNHQHHLQNRFQNDTNSKNQNEAILSTPVTKSTTELSSSIAPQTATIETVNSTVNNALELKISSSLPKKQQKQSLVLSPAQPQQPSKILPSENSLLKDTTVEAASTSTEESVPVLQQLRSILPGNLEMDASMMEHLARAAVELHHQRTGRKKSIDGLLASPNKEINGPVITPSLDLPRDSATISSMMTTEKVDDSTTPVDSSTAKTKHANSENNEELSVSWTASEKIIVNTALAEGMDPCDLVSALPNKTLQQLDAFVLNSEQQLATLNQQEKLDIITTTTTDTTIESTGNLNTAEVSDSNRSCSQLEEIYQEKSSKESQTTRKRRTVATAVSRNEDSDMEEALNNPAKNISTKNVGENSTVDAETGDTTPTTTETASLTPPKRGGRGRKPPTTAMNTVPNISMDVKSLLRRKNNATIALLNKSNNNRNKNDNITSNSSRTTRSSDK